MELRNIEEYQQILEFDWITYQFITKIKYFKQFNYNAKKNLIKNLRDSLGDKDVDNHFHVHIEENDLKRTLTYQKYYINLADYLHNMKTMSSNIILSPANLRYLFKVIFTNINMMAKNPNKRYYYSDYKPEMFVLMFDRFTKQHVLKLTQMEIISDQLYPTQSTEEFFSSPNVSQHMDVKLKKVVFADHEQRYKNEVYCGMRAFLYLCLNQKGVTTSSYFNDNHAIDRNSYLIDYITTEVYKDMKDKKLMEIFNFFNKEVLVINQFSYLDIDNLINGIHEKHFDDQLHTLQANSLQAIDLQIQNLYLNRDEKCFQKLVGVHSVIEQRCTAQWSDDAPSGNLFNEINKFITQKKEFSSEDNLSLQIFIILGQSGMGKTFSINTYGFQMMNQAYQNTAFPLPLLIDCAHHSREDVQKIYHNFKNFKKDREKIILLDNWDHIYIEKKQNIFEFFQINESDRIKIVLTAGPNSFSSQDYMDYFELRINNKHITYTRFYLTTLGSKQRIEFFDQFLKNCYQTEASQNIQLKTFQTPQQYESLIDEVKMQLAITPIDLKLISLVLPLMENFSADTMYKFFIKQIVLSQSLSMDEDDQMKLDLVKSELGVESLSSIEFPFDDFCLSVSQEMYLKKVKSLPLEDIRSLALNYLGIDKKMFEKDLKREVESNAYSSVDVDIEKQLSIKGPLKTFRKVYFELKFLIKLSPLIEKNNDTYEFYHTCIYQYYINRSIQLELTQLFTNIKKDRKSFQKQMADMFCNKVALSGNEKIMQEIVGFLKENSDTQLQQIIHNLLKIVYYSRSEYSKDVDNLSAFAFSILNHLDFSFSNLDLTGVRLPEANFGNGIFYNTNFSHTFLQKANFNKSILNNATFTDSTLTDSVFDTYPTLNRENYYPQCMVLSNNGSWLFTGGQDGLIICWDLEIYEEEKFTLNGGSHVTAIAINIRDTQLATSGSDLRVILWDLSDQTQLKVFSTHSLQILSLSFSQNCEFLASAGSDKSIKIYNLIELKQIHDLKNDSQINFIEFSHDSKNIASCCEAGLVYIWFLEVEKISFSFQSDEQEIYKSMVYLREGRFLVAGGSSQFIKIWDLSSGQIHKILNNQLEINQLSLSKDQKILIACSNKAKMVNLWNLQSFNIVRVLNFDQTLVGGAFFTVDQGKIIVGDEMGHINSIGYKEQHINLFEKKENPFLETPISFCQFMGTPPTSLLCISQLEGIRILDIERSKQLQNINEPNIEGFCFTEDGKRFALNLSGLIIIYYVSKLQDTDQNEQVIKTPYQRAIDEMRFSYDNKFLVCRLVQDHMVNIWQLDKTREVKKLDHGGEVTGFSFSRDNTYMITSGKYIKLWNVQTFEQVRVIQPLNDHVFTVGIFSRDCGSIICGSQAGVLVIIRVQVKDAKEYIQEVVLKVTDPLTGLLSLQLQINKIFMNHEGTIIVCAINDNTVFMYDMAMRCDLQQINCADKVRDCSFSSNDRYLSIAYGSKIEIWTNWTMVWNDKQEVVDYKKNVPSKWFLYKILTNNQEFSMSGLDAAYVHGLNKVQIKIMEQLCGLKLIIETLETNGTQTQNFEKDKNFKRKRANFTQLEEQGILSFFENKQRQAEEETGQMAKTLRNLNTKGVKPKKQVIKKPKKPFYNSMSMIKLKGQEVDLIVHQKLSTTIDQRRVAMETLISKISYPQKYLNPVPIFYQVCAFDQGQKRIQAKLQDMSSNRKLIVEASITLQKLKLNIVKLERFPANELILIYAGDTLIKGDIDVGNLQQIYGDYQDGWLYLTVVRSGVQIEQRNINHISKSLLQTKK